MEKSQNKQKNRIVDTLINSVELGLEKVEHIEQKIKKLEEEIDD